jgi:curved DNA-binding protein CbpA
MQFEEAKELIKDKNPLSIMGFNSLPNLIELKERYRKLMLEHHPDKGGDPLVCKKIIASFTVLEKRLLK